MKKQQSIEERIASMQTYDPAKEYYALTLTTHKDGRIEWGAQTHFEGFVDDTTRQEIRAASLVIPHRMVALWRNMGQPCVVVNVLSDLFVFVLIGGNALVDSNLADEKLPDIVKPEASVRIGTHGFVSTKSLHTSALNRAPTAKHRMRILERDQCKCKICGRRPIDHVDVELHVHHIRPWARGGTTTDDNLITLCHTCHKGLEPHETWSLFDLVNPRSSVAGVSHSLKTFREGVMQYRKVAWQALQGSPREKGVS